MLVTSARTHIISTARKHFIIVLGMFAFGFALVPLYDVFCDITGLNGKVRGAAEKVQHTIDNSRSVRVQLIASNNDNMPWRFMPLQEQIELHPGEWKQVGFWAANITDRDMVSQAVPSITPSRAAQYVQKSECFCFQQQALSAGESRQMNMVFTLSPDLPQDIKTVSMVYTLFDSTAFAASKTVAQVN
jgi:cytochrome c oxidase assembly protein subunit 11